MLFLYEERMVRLSLGIYSAKLEEDRYRSNMSEHDWRVLLYLMLMTSILMCLGTAYSVFFFGPSVIPVSSQQLLSPASVIILSGFFASANSFAVNLLSEFILQKVDIIPGKIKYALVIAVFIFTFVGSSILAIVAAAR